MLSHILAFGVGTVVSVCSTSRLRCGDASLETIIIANVDMTIFTRLREYSSSTRAFLVRQTALILLTSMDKLLKIFLNLSVVGNLEV